MEKLYNLGDALQEHILNCFFLFIRSIIYQVYPPPHTHTHTHRGAEAHVMLMTDRASINSRSVVFPKTLTCVWQRVNRRLYNDCNTQAEHTFCSPQTLSHEAQNRRRAQKCPHVSLNRWRSPWRLTCRRPSSERCSASYSGRKRGELSRDVRLHECFYFYCLYSSCSWWIIAVLSGLWSV